ncbi:unnamed protein product [Cunninghamella blakesleeana]
MSDTQTTCLVDVTNNTTIIDIKENTNTIKIKNIPDKVAVIDQAISTSPFSTSVSSPSSVSSTQSLACQMEHTHIHKPTVKKGSTSNANNYKDNNNKDKDTIIQSITNHENDHSNNNNNNTNKMIPKNNGHWCRYCGCLQTPRWRCSFHGLNTACNKCFYRHKYAVRRGETWELDWETSYYPVRPEKENIETIENNDRNKNKNKSNNNNNNNNRDNDNHSQKRPRLTSSPTIKTKETKKSVMGQLSKSTLRGKKQFLEAGLYSGTTNSNNNGNPTNVLKKDYSNIKFELPIHHGKWMLETEMDFDLPLDIMEDYEHDRLFLTGTSTKKPPRYARLQHNTFVERKPRKEDQPSICQCKKPEDGSFGCGEDCLNRMMFIECHIDTCPCEDKCSNLRFKKREFIKDLEIVLTKDRGWGLRTLIPIKKGSLITEYCGEIISDKTCQLRIQTVYRRQNNYYFLDYNRGEVIDACTKGSEARFINHGCDPNCHIEKWNRGGEYHLGVFASKNIEANEELFYDYNFSWFDTETIGQECFCGSKNCRGTLGKKKKA